MMEGQGNPGSEAYLAFGSFVSHLCGWRRRCGQGIKVAGEDWRQEFESGFGGGEDLVGDQRIRY